MDAFVRIALVLSIAALITVSTHGSPVSKESEKNLKLSETPVGEGEGSYYHTFPDGRYVMRYGTPAGVIHFETGYMRRLPDGTPYQVKEGYYIYPTADGKKVRLSYFADHEGYRVVAYDIRGDFVDDDSDSLVAPTESIEDQDQDENVSIDEEIIE